MRWIWRHFTYAIRILLDRLFDFVGIHAAYWIGAIVWERLYPDWWDADEQYDE